MERHSSLNHLGILQNLNQGTYLNTPKEDMNQLAATILSCICNAPSEGAVSLKECWSEVSWQPLNENS